MSSDTYSVKVLAIEGADVVLEVQPTTAGGLADMSFTRSFVLMLLLDQGAPIEYEKIYDKQWLAEHLDRFVIATRVESIRGLTHDGQLRQTAIDWCVPVEHLQPRLRLRATLASNELAALFPEGLRFGTTAFDSWWEDPKRPELPNPSMFEIGCWDPDPDFSVHVGNALEKRLDGWRATPGSTYRLMLPGPDAALRLELEGSRNWLRSTAVVRVKLDVPAMADLPRGRKPGESMSTELMTGWLYGPPPNHCWFREWDGPPSERQTLRFFAEDATLESHAALADRIAAELTHPDVATLTTRAGILGLFESGLGKLARRNRVADFAPIGNVSAPRSSELWNWDWRSGDPFWKRIAAHAALGNREDARAALAQAQKRWKKIPKAFTSLVAALSAS